MRLKRTIVYRYLAIIFLLSGCWTQVCGQTNASDAAYNRGVELYGMRKYAEAIPFFQKADSLERLDKPEELLDASYPLMWMSSCYFRLGNTDKAREIDPYNYMLTPVDRRLIHESDSLSYIGLDLLQEGDAENALDFFKRCGELEKTALGADSYFYANTLKFMAECYWNLGDYEQAFSMANSALKIQRLNGFDYGIALCYEWLGLICEYMDNKGPEDAFGYYQLSYDKYCSSGYGDESVNTLIEMSRLKQEMGEVQDAYDFCNKAKDIVDKESLFAEYPGSYAYMLSILAQAEYGLLMYEEAFMHSSEAKRLFEEDNINEYYASYMENEGWRAYLSMFVPECDHPKIVKEVYEAFMGSDDFKDSPMCKKIETLYYKCNPDNIPLEKRIAAQRRLVKEIEEIEGYKSASYLEVLADILNEHRWETNEDMQNIISIYKEIGPIREEAKELGPSDETNLFKNMAMIEYGILNNSGQAIATLTEGIDILKQWGWQYQLYCCQLLNQIAQIYIGIGEFSVAYEYLLEAMEAYAVIDENNKHLGVYQRNEYVLTLKQLIAYYGNIGDFKRQEECVNKLNIASPDSYDEDLHMLTYKLSAILNSAKTDGEKREEAVRMFSNLLSSIEKSEGRSSIDYNLVNLLYSSILIGLGNTEEADKVISESKGYLEGTAAAVPAELLYGQLLMFKGNLEEAVPIFEKILPIAEASSIVSPQDLAFYYQSLVSIYESKGRLEKVQPYIKKINDIYKDILNSNFRSMSYQERSSLWNKFSNWFTAILPAVAFRGDESTLDEDLYDGILLSKGLLLNSEIELRKLVASAGDEYSLALYDKLQDLYMQQKKAADNPAEYERITREVATKERELANSVKAFGDYTENLAVTWKDVRDRLSQDEAAIEFVQAPLNQDSIMYSALVLKSGTSPKRVNLFSQQELTAIPADSLYTTSKLSSLVWEPLSEELGAVKNVYFAPQGMLHSMAIEYAPTSDGGYISDKYNLYRLSSTRERILSHTTKKEQYAVLYGGLSYDADTTAVMRANDDQTDHYVFKPRAAIENIRDVAQGISDLQYTLEEVEEIDNLYSAVNEDCYSFKGIYGTEESFKNLSGTGKTVLHLATHGFYYTEAEHKDKFNMIQALDILGNTAVSSEDKMLTRSGLFLTGANLALTQKSIPDNMEDGILTAQEISFLDLRDVDLVVLSACKSAMGELGGDGVFGLQRGFKKAGAKTLLMSLWNVDDKATKLLMTEFYKNWLGVNEKHDVMSKREAFLKAQEYLRTTENGRYKSPEFWAAFVMLDGVD